MSPFTPMLIERKPVPKVWGGNKLDTLLGLAPSVGDAIGESWLLFDRPDGSSTLSGTPETLRDLMQRDARALLGEGVEAGHGGRFPLMLKFIDARERLSLQVHPDDDQARGEDDSGKNEACVVLSAGPDARLVRGLRPGVTPEQFAAAASTPAVEELLFAFTPKAGDCVVVPTGMVHSFGPDVLIFEVCQNSEVTYRLNDWGRGRDVHVEKAMAVTCHDNTSDDPVVEPRPLPDGGHLLVDNQWFSVRRYELSGGLSLATNGRFLTVTVIGGGGVVGWRGGADDPLRVGPGDTVLVPECVNEVFVSPHGALDALVCSPGLAR